jgi:hypothetical protein
VTDDIYADSCRLTSQDDDGLKDFSAFLSKSRSGRALMSNVATLDDGSRSLLVYVRKLDGELAAMGVQLADNLTRKSGVKMMREAGVEVQNLPGPIAIERVPIH